VSISQLYVLKVFRKIGSIVIRAAGFYVAVWATLLLSFLVAEAVTGYIYPENPIESDYPVPVIFDVLFFFSPYIFCLLVVTGYDLVKYVRKNESTYTG